MKKLTVPLLIISSLNAINCAYAQKLPNVQQASLRVPANIKIDGKANEWNNQFQAHNKATDITYTMCNDDQYLYLALQADVPNAINKIFAGGITLSMHTSGKKDDKGGVSITYPITEKKGG